MPLEFYDLVLDDNTPIYQQIIRYVKVNMVTGMFTNGDEMPSRRMLSTALGVNPNTIQKAYKQLEEEGILVSYAGSKSLLVVTGERVIQIKKEFLQDETTQFITALKQIGLQLEDAVLLLEQEWKAIDKGEKE